VLTAQNAGVVMQGWGERMIVIGGENLIDSVQTQGADGSPVFAHKLGGSPYNVAVALARQGQVPHYVTPISTDDFGTQLADHLVAEGVIVAAPRSDRPTTQAIVTLKAGVPEYVFHRDGTAERAVTEESIIAAMPDGARHLHIGSLALFGGPDADAWEAVFHRAAADGLTTSLDPNLRPALIGDEAAYRARLGRMLATASIVKLSDEDLAWIYPGLPQADAMAQLREATKARLVVLTKGPDGASGWAGEIACDVTVP
jgi:fructokinase